jgi:ATP-dependent DNA ligase
MICGIFRCQCVKPTLRGCSPDGRTAFFRAILNKARSGRTCLGKSCEFGFEGLVSKRRDRPYRAGRSPYWVKVKNRSHPAMNRVKDAGRLRP